MSASLDFSWMPMPDAARGVKYRPASCTLLVLFGGQMCHVLTSRSLAA